MHLSNVKTWNKLGEKSPQNAINGNKHSSRLVIPNNSEQYDENVIINRNRNSVKASGSLLLHNYSQRSCALFELRSLLSSVLSLSSCPCPLLSGLSCPVLIYCVLSFPFPLISCLISYPLLSCPAIFRPSLLSLLVSCPALSRVFLSSPINVFNILTVLYDHNTGRKNMQYIRTMEIFFCILIWNCTYVYLSLIFSW